MTKHPRDDDKPKEHPEPHHTHNWQPVYNEWREIQYYLCPCGAMKPA